MSGSIELLIEAIVSPQRTSKGQNFKQADTNFLIFSAIKPIKARYVGNHEALARGPISWTIMVGFSDGGPINKAIHNPE